MIEKRATRYAMNAKPQKKTHNRSQMFRMKSTAVPFPDAVELGSAAVWPNPIAGDTPKSLVQSGIRKAALREPVTLVISKVSKPYGSRRVGPRKR
ncbi:hypothetical protein GCM10011313_29640 [Mycetocola zhadangensis]|nr:hypothetical protein GCM10011313_29640 [Mycetocola zhadangensis]